MTRVNPVPKVWLDDLGWANCQGANIHTSNQTVLKDLDIPWGRAQYFEHPQPAVATVRLYVPDSSSWADRLRTKAAMGKKLHVAYYDEELARDFVTFRGNVSEVQLDRQRIAGDNGVHGWLVTLRATSRETECGNINAAKQDTFPPETALNRAIRLDNYTQPITGIQDIFFAPGDVNKTMWGPDDASGQNLLAHIQTFYQSFGFTYWYDPDQNTIRYVTRYLPGNGGLYLALLPAVPGEPRYVVIRPSYSYVWYGGDIQSWSSHLPGRHSIPSGSVSMSRADGVNRIQADWRDQYQTPAWGDWSTLLPSSWPAGQLIRLYRFTSWLDDGVNLDPVVANLYDLATDEASLPPLPEFTWRTQHDGGFGKWSDARQYLTAAEWPHFVYLSGCELAEWLGITPLVARIGGRVRWDGKHWHIGIQPAWANAENLDPAVGLTWSDLTALGIKWGEVPPDFDYQNDYYLHPSITYADLQRVTDNTLYTY